MGGKRTSGRYRRCYFFAVVRKVGLEAEIGPVAAFSPVVEHSSGVHQLKEPSVLAELPEPRPEEHDDNVCQVGAVGRLQQQRKELVLLVEFSHGLREIRQRLRFMNSVAWEI